MIKIGVVRGLKSINAVLDAEEAKFNGGEKTRWFKLNDKESVKVVFLQELDPDSENYSQKNDLGILAVEHVNPDNFRNKALCTIDDEGQCFGCEQHQKDFKAGWKQKNRLYINVLVDNGTDDPYVAVLSQGNGPKSVTPALIEQATEMGSISDRWMKIKRNGAGLSDTSYVLTPLKEHGLNVEDYDLYDLDKVVRHVPYAEQEAHYFANTGVKEEPSEAVSSPAATDDDTW
jgi:hypothetical protein